jgi:hypothetical protein
MKTGLFCILLILSLIACSKDKFQTKPQLKFKSKNTGVVEVNQSLIITMEYTDKEGDVDDSLILVRQRLNRRGLVTLPPSPYPIPKFPNTNKGEFEVTLGYQFGLIVGLPPIRIPGGGNEPDTMNLKFVARDHEGNKSDTLVVSNIIVKR